MSALGLARVLADAGAVMSGSGIDIKINTGGCLATILSFTAVLLLIWGLLFGVTYKGKWYGFSCSRSHGVTISP